MPVARSLVRSRSRRRACWRGADARCELQTRTRLKHLTTVAHLGYSFVAQLGPFGGSMLGLVSDRSSAFSNWV